MSRQKKCRRICSLPRTTEFIPITGPLGRQEEVVMSIDEYESVRLMDYVGLTQEECASQMMVARTTVTGIYEGARKKIAEVLVCGKRLVIEGGEISVCDRNGGPCCNRRYQCQCDHCSEPCQNPCPRCCPVPGGQKDG